METIVTVVYKVTWFLDFSILQSTSFLDFLFGPLL